VIAAPPVDNGADQVTVAWADPAVAVPMTGALGVVDGVTMFDADDAGPVPLMFVAATLNEYGVPLIRPVTVHTRGPETQVHIFPSGLEVTV